MLFLDHVQIGIPSGAEARAREFYCERLGLREIPKSPEVLHTGGIWLELGSTQLHLGIEDENYRLHTRNHIGIRVRDLAATRALMESLKLPIQENTPIAGIRRFSVRDPFGNKIEFVQRTNR